jgi:hypothetical protein
MERAARPVQKERNRRPALSVIPAKTDPRSRATGRLAQPATRLHGSRIKPDDGEPSE